MSKIETPLTIILLVGFLILLTSHIMNGNAKKERQLLIDSRTLNVMVEHDNDPETKTIDVVLYADSSYDNENDDIEYYWKQISGNDADIEGSREKSVLHFVAEAGDPYGFELTITDSYGASDLDTHWVNVDPEPNTSPVVIIKD